MGAVQPGIVVLVRFPFSDLSASKLRPVARASGVDWVLCQVTSNPYGDPAAVPLPSASFASGGLGRESFAREVRLHREWMIRVFALAMGVATIRVFVGLLEILWHHRFDEVFGTAFWLGFGVNLVVAEVSINKTRAMPSNRPLQPTGASIASARG